MITVDEFLKLPNWTTITITKINPDHGDVLYSVDRRMVLKKPEYSCSVYQIESMYCNKNEHVRILSPCKSLAIRTELKWHVFK